MERASAFARCLRRARHRRRAAAAFEADPSRSALRAPTCATRRNSAHTERRAGSVLSAPGGQLVLQATDRWIAVRGARIVLLDDTGVRARMAAAWLRQMGHRDVFVVARRPERRARRRPADAAHPRTGRGPADRHCRG